jgi:hypothetical protein
MIDFINVFMDSLNYHKQLIEINFTKHKFSKDILNIFF